MSHRVRAAALVLAGAAGVLALLLAADVLLSWRDARADDFRFRAAPARQLGLWDDVGVIPGSLAVRTLGIEDDLAYRRAVSLFARVKPNPYPTQEESALRGQATLALTRVSRSDGDPRRRSQLLNFLGVLPLDRRIQEAAERAAVLQSAIGTFQSAVRVDPDNADAKLNLEIVLRIANTAAIPANQPSGERAGGERSGSGTPGGGY